MCLVFPSEEIQIFTPLVSREKGVYSHGGNSKSHNKFFLRESFFFFHIFLGIPFSSFYLKSIKKGKEITLKKMNPFAGDEVKLPLEMRDHLSNDPSFRYIKSSVIKEKT